MSDNWCKKRRCVRGLIKCIQIVYFLFLTENMCIEDSETKSVWISRTQTNAFDLIEKAFVWMCAEYGQRFSLALHWCWWYGVILPNVTKLQEENDKIEFEKQSNAYIDVSTTSVCQFVWRFYATYNIGINIQNKEFFFAERVNEKATLYCTEDCTMYGIWLCICMAFGTCVPEKCQIKIHVHRTPILWKKAALLVVSIRIRYECVECGWNGVIWIRVTFDYTFFQMD